MPGAARPPIRRRSRPQRCCAPDSRLHMRPRCRSREWSSGAGRRGSEPLGRVIIRGAQDAEHGRRGHHHLAVEGGRLRAASWRIRGRTFKTKPTPHGKRAWRSAVALSPARSTATPALPAIPMRPARFAPGTSIVLTTPWPSFARSASSCTCPGRAFDDCWARIRGGRHLLRRAEEAFRTTGYDGAAVLAARLLSAC